MINQDKTMMQHGVDMTDYNIHICVCVCVDTIEHVWWIAGIAP